DRAVALIDLAKAIDGARHPRYSERAAAGWVLADAKTVLEPLAQAGADEAYTSGSAIRTAGSIDFMKRFDRAVRGDTDLASTLIAQQGADEEGVLLASIEAAPDELVAREW